MSSAPTVQRTLLEPVVRRFLGDDHVVHVALSETGRREAQELRLVLQLGYAARAAISHARPQTADQLINHFRNRTLVWHTALDSFRNQFAAALLCVAVGCAFCGRHSTH